jgi:hypothetical protein
MYKTFFLIACHTLLFNSVMVAADDDADGIDSAVEITIGTDPLDADTDNDLIVDGLEDLDQDGVVDAGETNPRDADTDDDAVRDGEEKNSSLNPLLADSDNDGLNDGMEIGLSTRISGGNSASGIAYLGTAMSWIADSDPGSKTDPLAVDSDNDGISDGGEDKNRNGNKDVTETSPVDADNDDDGLKDGQEDVDMDGVLDSGETDPIDSDTDNDGLNDGLEKGKNSPIAAGTSAGAYAVNRIAYMGTAAGWVPDSNTSTTTNPRSTDTDNDGLADGIEDADQDGNKDTTESDPTTADTDGDSVNDFSEGLINDTDSDGIINCLDTDDDGDGIPTLTEGGVSNFDADANPDYLDTDSDSDGIPDATEGSSDSPLDTDTSPNYLDLDSDGDAIPDQTEGSSDSALDTDDILPNYLDRDSDGDGIDDAIEGAADSILDTDASPNYLDLDSDGDTLLDSAEGGILDTDNDGAFNYTDADSDNDGSPDSADNCYLTPNPGQADFDLDLIGDACDPDDDNDGSLDGFDCDPFNSSIHQGAIDIPDDGIDQDCNGNDSRICYVDEDQDGYGNILGITVIAEDGTCMTSREESDNNTDCADNNSLYHPGAGETCDDPDFNCDGKLQASSSHNIDTSVCNSYTAPDGQVYTTSGIKTAVISNAAGCDSTITIDLTVNQSTESHITEIACSSYTAPDGQVYTTSGIKTAVIPNIAGCDSTITIDLTVNQTTESHTTEKACDSFAWNGIVYTSSGDYTFTTTNTAGCDSIANLHLTIDPTPPTPVITQAGTVLQSDAPEGNQWYDQNGLINEAINQDYTVTVENTYYTIVSLSGCSSLPSNAIHVIVTGIESTETESRINVYPNPVSDEFTVEYDGFNDRSYLEIVNISGWVVYQGSFSRKTTVQADNFLPGLYMIRVSNGNTTDFIKILVE